MSLGARRPDLLVVYYLVTPAFVFADVGLGLPVRVAGLPSPDQRLMYYAAVFALGLLCRARPRVAPFAGIVESATNLTLLFLSILLPIWSLPDAVASGAPLAAGLTPLALVNAVLSGTVMIASFQRSRAAAEQEVRGWWRGRGGH